MHASCLFHDLSDAGFAKLERFESIIFGAELFGPHAHTSTIPEVNLLHREEPFWILLWVDFAQNLKVSKSVTFFLLSLW